VTSSFQSPRSFDPSYSLLGRAFRSWTGDRLRGEALYIVALTGLALVLLMSHYLGWALLQSTLAENPSWQMLFWAGQLASAAVWAAVGLIGFRPGVTVSCGSSAVTLAQGNRTHAVPYDAIEQVDTIAATTYHRHYRRYAATAVFAGPVSDEVLLLHTADGPVVVALPDAEAQAALADHLERATVDEAATPVPQA